MTGAQRSYLKTLCEEAKVPFDDNLRWWCLRRSARCRSHRRRRNNS